jgi:MFS-type transporter involved in bile tolerance (Atg22 family)
MEFWTGSIRYSIVAVAAFFIIGFVALLFVPKEETEL